MNNTHDNTENDLSIPVGFPMPEAGLPEAEAIREFQQKIAAQLMPYRELIAYYRCAMMEVKTKFDVLNEALSLDKDHNPIESIKTRLKTPESIALKMHRKNLPFSIESLEENIEDIAGVRVICSYPSDIYMLADALLKQDDVRLLKKKDYFQNPKKNGYRSLHLIIEIPIFLHNRKKYMKVEIQLRTLSMDWWASLEHKIRYKKDLPEETLHNIEADLLRCAELARILDEKMERISLSIDPLRDPANHAQL